MDHSICPDLLTAGSVVLDLGANYGAFANATARRLRCNVYAVEASSQGFAKMPTGDLVKKFNVAICGRLGVVTLNISSNHEVTSLKRLDNWEYIDTIQVQGLSLDEFLKTESILRLTCQGLISKAQKLTFSIHVQTHSCDPSIR